MRFRTAACEAVMLTAFSFAVSYIPSASALPGVEAVSGDGLLHYVFAEYEAWFGPDAVTFEQSPVKPLLRSASMQAKGLSGYDSADPAVIRQHVQWLEQMGVDGVLADLTNGANCAFFDDYKKYCSPRDRVAFRAIRDNTGNLYPAYQQIGTRLTIVPLIGAGESSHYDLDSDGKTAVEKELDYFIGLARQYPSQAFAYEGKPLIVAYMGAAQSLAPDAPWRRFLSLVQAKGYAAQATIRLMAGFVDDQAQLWSNPKGLVGLREAWGFWSWVDRLNVPFNLLPSYVVYQGKPENLTASIATPSRQDGWGDAKKRAYSPEDGLRAEGATFRAFMQYARSLQPTLLFLHQFNEYGENGWDAEGNSDIEPTDTWGTSMLSIVRDEVAAYRASMAPQVVIPPAAVTPPATSDVALSILINGQLTPVTYKQPACNWYIGTSGPLQFGLPGDLPLIIQWSGANHIAVYRPSLKQLIVNTDNQAYHVSNQLILQ